MDRSKIVAVVTGAIALLLGIVYLVIVQFLDFRGEMLPAPQVQMLQNITLAAK
ncbi:MAG: glucose-inhibited division protein A [Tatlockia sp.]|nr:glucose-inhibited division protein A [Tatlockia sp.]